MPPACAERPQSETGETGASPCNDWSWSYKVVFKNKIKEKYLYYT